MFQKSTSISEKISTFYLYLSCTFYLKGTVYLSMGKISFASRSFRCKLPYYKEQFDNHKNDGNKFRGWGWAGGVSNPNSF